MGLAMKSFQLEKNAEDIYRIDYLMQLTRGKYILHLGCVSDPDMIKNEIAQGVWLHKLLTDNSAECLGIDINKEGIEFIKNNINMKNVIYADIQKDGILEIMRHKWDFIVLGEVLEHVCDPVSFLRDIVQNYGEFIDKYIITVPNALSLINAVDAALKNSETIYTDHMYWFTPYTLYRVIDKAGLFLDHLLMCSSGSKEYLENSQKGKFLRRFRSKIYHNLLTKRPLLNNDIIMVCKR
jgi:hypothetical protein